MALLGNYSVILKNPATFIGGTQVSNCRNAFGASGQNAQMYYGESEEGGLPLTSSLPTGTEPPFSYHLAEKGGELSATTMLTGSSDFAASQANGINIVSTIAGSGVISDAGLSLVTSMIAAIAGSGTLTGSMVGTVQFVADLAGSGNITGALNMLSGMVANLAGQGLISSDLKGKLFMEADIYVNESQATVNQIVDGVLEATASEHNNPGTIGEKINDAGSAGDPWGTDVVSGGYTGNQAGKIIQDISDNAELGAIK